MIKSQNISDVFDIKARTLKLLKKNTRNCNQRNMLILWQRLFRRAIPLPECIVPICVKEILEFLQITPGQTGLDATLGYGGHTLEMLKCLNSKGHLYAIDVDSLELPRTKERLERLGYGSEILKIKQMNFSEIDQIASESGPFNFVLADLGVSSMQIDNPERGFSFKTEGPLDLRLNPKKGKSAATRLKTISLDELQGMFIENADEPHSAEIARAIISKIKKGIDISTTTQLQQIIKDALKFIPGNK